MKKLFIPLLTLTVIFLILLTFSLLVKGSDLSEEVIPPVRAGSKSDVSLRHIQNFFLTRETNQQTIALVTYPISRNEKAWDNLDRFAQSLDQKFFKPLNKKIVAGSAFCALFGAIVPHPSCGYVIENTGNFLHVPLSGAGSDVLVAWLTISTTPVFMQQSFNLGKRLLTTILNDPSFTPPAKDEDSQPHVFKKATAHYAAKVFTLAASSVNAAIPLILMRDAEKRFPLFFATTAVPFYFAWLENYYRVGSKNIDHLFEFYRYTARSNYQKRDILKDKIVGFKEAINKNDKLAKNIFDVLEGRKQADFQMEDGNAFAFSMFFLRNVARMADDEGTGLLMNFKTDVDTAPSVFADHVLEWASTFITGAGIYTRYEINQYVINGLLTELGMAQEASFAFSTSLSAFEAVYRLTSMNTAQQTYFKGLKNCVRLSGNFPLIRKGLGMASLANGVLFSLPNLVAGLKVFETSSMISKVAFLAPSFLMDLSYYDSFFNRQYNALLTNLSSFKERNIGLMGKRAHLNYYADRAYAHISEFDAETIEKIYHIVQKGV